MAESKPQMGPEGSSGSGAGAGTSGAASAPSAIPPGGAAKVAAKGDCGCGGSATGGSQSAGTALPPTVGTGDAAPSMHPAESVGANVTTWLNDKRITGLWSLNQNRNSWVYVNGIGWKKLANNSDSAIVALSMLGAHARDKDSAVNYREESDAMIREMYVW